MLKLGTYESWFDGEVVVPGETLATRLKNLESWGYQGVQLQRLTRDLGPAVLKPVLAGSSIQLCIYGGADGLLAPDRQIRQSAVELIKEGLHQAAELAALGSLVVPVRGPHPQIEAPDRQSALRLEREILIDELAEIAPVAEAVGVPVILEPLNRYETHLINRLEQGADICRAVGSPGIKIMADFYHMNIEEADIGQAIEQATDCLAYVHLADSNRFQPGAGHLDFRPGLAALKRIGYDGFMTLECRILGKDKGKALAETARYVRELWEQV